MAGHHITPTGKLGLKANAGPSRQILTAGRHLAKSKQSLHPIPRQTSSQQEGCLSPTPASGNGAGKRRSMAELCASCYCMVALPWPLGIFFSDSSTSSFLL